MEITSIIVALLVIAAAWAVYLLPVVFSDRRGASLSSTEEFDLVLSQQWTLRDNEQQE